jgi:hypothetical protein
MADEPSTLHEIPYLRLFPWLRLVRGIGVAADPKKLMLAAIGLVLLHLGWDFLFGLFPGSGPITPHIAGRADTITPRLLLPLQAGLPEDRESVAADVVSAPWRLTEPVRYLVGPFLGIFALGSTAATFFKAMLVALWGVVVWGIIGGATSRIAVVQVARSERVGTMAALRFAASKGLTLIGAPVCPLLGIALFTVPCALFGLAYRAGPTGQVAAGALLFLPLLAGLIMTLILIGMAAGWPLMTAAVAAESEDGFDALSRAYAYVNQRAGRYAAYWLLAWLIGIVGLVVVDLFARMVVHLTHWALSFGAPETALANLFGPGGSSSQGAYSIHAFWLSFVGLLAHAWIFSYFWTSAATIYLLLRRDVDGTDWHEVAMPARKHLHARPEPVEEVGGPSNPAAPPELVS